MEKLEKYSISILVVTLVVVMLGNGWLLSKKIETTREDYQEKVDSLSRENQRLDSLVKKREEEYILLYHRYKTSMNALKHEYFTIEELKKQQTKLDSSTWEKYYLQLLHY